MISLKVLLIMLSGILLLLLAWPGSINADSSPFSTSTLSNNPFSPKKSDNLDGGQCFCQLKGQIDDCLCSVDTVDYFNNMKIFPRLQSLLAKPFFRYFRYHPSKPCPFWDGDSGKCASTNCKVSHCQSEEVPEGLKAEVAGKGDKGGIDMHPYSKYTEDAQSCDDEDDDSDLDGRVDVTISDEDRANLARWQKHDSSLQDFCDVEADSCAGCEFVDLTINPERFTGYAGEASHRIWRSIYEENCFKPPGSSGIAGDKGASFSAAFLQDTLSEMCLEKRAFYRAVSGLHTSITIHLCANYLLSNGNGPFEQKTFGPNLDEFQARFDPDKTRNQGPFWLRNLYFVYLLELRALTKVAPYLEKQTFFTGAEEEDKDTQIAVKELLNLMRSFPDHFDERVMFAAGGQTAGRLKSEFRQHFLNVSRIMDCVGCDKCRLWGKLQVTGLGTALKILFADEAKDLKTWEAKLTSLEPPVAPEETSQSPRGAPTVDPDEFSLTRNEIVALFNAFGRISTSIQQLEKFRQRLE